MSFSRKVYEFITLHSGEEDKNKVLEAVRANVTFKGANLWILACAIVIASIGLNVNSTAVIIGAMLISPLMGPIVGAGFALGTYNFDLLKKSMRNLLVATLVGLVVSFLYFYVSPFKETQSELLARTSPNIYDVLIAFFGGLVGVIAITRVEKGNPIPGVAIATALMPPLCTAGYGLAIGNIYYFLGAFYLYTINCFFICIATFAIIKYLKYSPVKFINKSEEKKIRYGITALIFIMVIPSFYLAYNLYQQRSFTNNVEQFINNEFTANGYTVIYKKINFNSTPREVDLAFLTKKVDSSELVTLNKRLANYKLFDTKLVIKQDDQDLKNEILKEINSQNRQVSDKDIAIQGLQQELSVYKQELSVYKDQNLEVLKEMKILFPELSKVSIGKHLLNPESDSVVIETVLTYQSPKKDAEKEEKIKEWLGQKLKTKNILVLRED